MTISITYSHAVPRLRQQLCYEVHAAGSASTKREQVARLRAAWAFSQALETLRCSRDAANLWVDGIMERDALPSQAVEQAVTFLGPKAIALLGLSAEEEEVVRGLRARDDGDTMPMTPS